MKVFSETVPPNALEAEQAVIGSMLQSPVGRMVCAQGLTKGDFYAATHGELFGVLADMDTEGTLVDLVTVTARLRALGLFDKIGGISYLTNCMNQALYTDHPEAYVKLVKEAANRRRLLHQLRQGIALAEDETRPFEEVQAAAEAGVLSLRQAPEDTWSPTDWANRVETEAALLEAGLEPRKRIRTGLTDLDHRLRLYPGHLTVLAGSTSHGKSAVSIAIAANAVLQHGHRTYLWSGEMDRDECLTRIAAAQCGVPYGALQDRKVDRHQLDAVKTFSERLEAAPLTICDRPMTVAELAVDARFTAHKGKGIDLIIVDYLSLLGDLNRETEDGSRRDVRIGIVTWNLIQVARKLDAHVILLHQLNRNMAARATNRPTLSDLKDSSTIEQHANNVALLYRPWRDDKLSSDQAERLKGCLEVNIAKQRAGQTGSVWLSFVGDTQQVRNLAKPWPSLTTSKPKRGD